MLKNYLVSADGEEIYMLHSHLGLSCRWISYYGDSGFCDVCVAAQQDLHDLIMYFLSLPEIRFCSWLFESK